jgi:hypothetical protein
MKWKQLIVFLSVFIFQKTILKSQESPVLLPEFSYGYGIPGGDLKDRFDTHLCLGLGLTYQPAKSHFNIGARFSYFFGSDVKEDVLTPFRTSYAGLLIGVDQYMAEFKLKERGFIFQLHTGGLIPVFSQSHARQSLKWQLGVGFIEHYIRFVDDARALTQFNDDYLKGLDRLCSGVAVSPFVGYEYISRKGWLSFYTGFETVFGFTQSRRSLNYDTNKSDLGIAREDILMNFKFGLYLPFFLNEDSAKIEY